MTADEEKKRLGRWGEGVIAEYLRQKGYTLEAWGWHCRGGEIDLIVSDREYLCFVEVKLRKNAAFAQAREYVDWNKQTKVKFAAEMYLESHPTQLQPRFDVAEVYAPQGMATKEPIIHYFEDAFS